MNLRELLLHPYAIPLVNGTLRSGLIVQIVNENEESGYGEIAPLPSWSRETLEEAKQQIELHKERILSLSWTKTSLANGLKNPSLFPSVSFGLESAFLSLLSPLSPFKMPISAFFLGTPEEVWTQAQQRHKEGYTSAKLKIGHLSFAEAKRLIMKLKDLFFLRIDVNRAWETENSLRFFSAFAKTDFDYVEEPFQNPGDLAYFSHPLAVDESFPSSLSLNRLTKLPTLKALIYKPTLQGGLIHAKGLDTWCKKQKVSLVLSSAFESDIGLSYIASIGKRLGLSSPLGIGTHVYLTKYLSEKTWSIDKGIRRQCSRFIKDVF